MKVFIVMDSNNSISPEVFSSYEKAKAYLLEHYKNFLGYVEEKYHSNWVSYEEALSNFEYVGGIWNFMYIVEKEIDRLKT